MIGKEILNYRITALLGRGGMGSVYLAEHKLISNQRVAIKVINANMVNDFTRNMLKDEAEHLAGLHHHNIVAFHDYHIDKSGNIYLVMEYADGKSLDDFIKNVNGLIVEDRICPLFEPILDGVGYAHKKGILHRDIKPANIVITTEGVPKILDFGIAQLIKNGADEERDNIVMGTPSYMSPEQVKGEHLDARSDIYSLGVLLHQMLTGNAPYDTTTLTEQDINKKVVEEPLPRIKTFYKYVSENVQKVVDKATAKNPADRYQTCEEMKKALHRAIYPWKPTLWMKAAAVAVLVLLVGAGLYVWDYNRVKTCYYKDYVEQWGVPQGVGELSAAEHGRIRRSYKFVYQKRKLLRVTHVNSFGHPMEDGESERNERPVDQELFYTEDGKVSRIKIRDRGGKILCVKSFNEKLNTMAFQYDDEHGTERAMSNATIGYVRPWENDINEIRGRISRWWLDYDENGFVQTIRYAGLDNSPVGDENGIYGRTYVRDEKGRPVEIHYIGIDGKPQPTKWGLAVKKFYYDDEDNWVKAEYLATDGKPAQDAPDGLMVYVMEYDENGNQTYALHYDADGKLMYPKRHNVAGIHNIYDDKGQITCEEFLDIDRKPMFIKGQGVAIARCEYDENGYETKRSFYGPDGEPVEGSNGVALWERLYDAKGNMLEERPYSLKHELVELEEGYAVTKFEYDSIGNILKIVHYDKKLKPCTDKNGNAGILFEHDDRGLLVKVTYLGTDLKPGPGDDSVAIVKNEYDRRGNNTRRSFYRKDGKTRVIGGEGHAGWNNIFDEHGNHIERNFFDTKGKLCTPTLLSYARVKYTYDEHNNLRSMRYYDHQDKLTLVDRIAGNDYIRDRRGNVLEEKPIGTDGQLAYGKLICRYKYDSKDNCTEFAVYDQTGAVENNLNYHRAVYTYDARNQRIEERRYDTKGNLAVSASDNSAIDKVEYDDKGQIISRRYFGADEKPCKCSEGWSSATYEYNSIGQVVKQCFFGTDGKPSDPKDMVPVGIAKYDKWGHCIYVAAQDGKGNYIVRPTTGWCIARFEYDNKDNKLSEAYYDSKDKPTLSQGGFHRMEMQYDTYSRMAGKSFYGKDGKPMLMNKYHKEVYKYVEHTNKVLEMALLGTDGKPTDCAAGWHKCVTTYNDDLSLALVKKYYRANGTLMKTIRWDGQQWKEDFNWQTVAREFAKELPQSFGPNAFDFCIQSFTITGSNSCEMRCTVPYTVSELSAENIELLKNVVSQMTKMLDEALKYKAYVTGTLYDKNGTVIYSVRS